MEDKLRSPGVAIPEMDLWEGPWRLNHDELRLHAGDGQGERRVRYWEPEE